MSAVGCVITMQPSGVYSGDFHGSALLFVVWLFMLHPATMSL